MEVNDTKQLLDDIASRHKVMASNVSNVEESLHELVQVELEKLSMEDLERVEQRNCEVGYKC